ncbi:GNAT family N-acetyltransferase [Acinetobacter haemolyticus]|uniref:GNAT family N-acetyltransferase n=1 Tax=Acinetobacter haemolyticus TaxID=29430 RepID=A0AAJ2YTQ0_ACIHA|nr:GNAT family N-acetyltransferase [Acinetobacter haemolyticus]ATZ68604.1 GNAT family N-acetyltransferase [Acinetobacter haemolyticus]NAR17297.1 GNAT family N-acetyltransferase [Acinetobacter haemolyticus]NAR35191.1 GNAT family N-acetyltransferase [Acinetobacter haemolyticus]NAR47469.1 GNAT family N-acetyltransferase [Acinetobacter haemolyticus]NAR64931.1 GNAT family N-acetyltransferase [Acinetobacter haemolyticus]
MYPVQRRTWLELTELQQAQLEPLLFAADPDWAVISTYLLQADIFVMINEQDRIIAQLCLIQNADQAEIKNLAVDPSQQGQGLAKTLILYVVGALQQSSIHTLWIKTGNSSLDQLALYQKCGFRMSHIERNVFQNYPEPIFENGIRCLDQVVLSIEYDLQTN